MEGGQMILLHDWAGKTAEDVFRDFELADPPPVEILLASYDCWGYGGDAFVLFRKDGALFEVNATHCSCYKLQGQWEPEDTTVAALRKRLDDGELGVDTCKKGRNVFADELRQLLSQLSTELNARHRANVAKLGRMEWRLHLSSVDSSRNT